MRLHHLAIVLGLLPFGACAKKQTAAQKPVPAANTPSDPQPIADPVAPAAAAPATESAAPSGSRSPVKKGGDPEDGGQ
jgi:hypothetical protein